MAHRLSRKPVFKRKRLRSAVISAYSRTSNLFRELIEGGPAAYYLSPFYPLPDEGSLTPVEKQKSDPDQDRRRGDL